MNSLCVYGARSTAFASLGLGKYLSEKDALPPGVGSDCLLEQFPTVSKWIFVGEGDSKIDIDADTDTVGRANRVMINVGFTPPPCPEFHHIG